MGLTLGVDIGGTKIAAGVVDDDGRIVRQDKRATPARDPHDLALAVADLVDSLDDVEGGGRIEAVGIGAAGFVDLARATVLFAPNIDWRDEPLAERVSRTCGLPVVVENDANAAAWGEFRFGAGADARDLLMITVGTGIGGGIVEAGRLVRGGFGVAAEVGHLRVVPGGLLCGCGQLGCWEQYGSGSALVRSARLRIGQRLASATPLLEAAGGDPAAVNGPLITRLAVDGDPLCVGLIAEVGRWVGEGVATLSAVLDPTVVAIGGGVAAAGDLLLGPAYDAYLTTLPAAAYRPHAVFRPASLGNDAGIIGAADLARVHG